MRRGHRPSPNHLPRARSPRVDCRGISGASLAVGATPGRAPGCAALQELLVVLPKSPPPLAPAPAIASTSFRPSAPPRSSPWSLLPAARRRPAVRRSVRRNDHRLGHALVGLGLAGNQAQRDDAGPDREVYVGVE